MSILRLWLCLLLILPVLVGAQESSPPVEAETPAAPSTPPPSTAGVTMPAGANVAIIKIEGMIYDFTLESLKRRVERAKAAGASIIVIELDTLGGVATAGLDISRYIKTIPMPTVAWVNDTAYSAGILIASACDEIVMSPASVTGDCAPIVPSMELPPTERAKALSPLLEEFRDSARNNGYDYVVFHAMCVLGVEVYQIEHKETGERKLVNQADYAVMVGGQHPDAVRGSPGMRSFFGLGGSSQAPSLDVAAPNIEVATEADMAKWELVRQVHDGRTLLTLNQTRAEEIGLSKATVRNEAELTKRLGAASVIPVPQTWSEGLAGWLTNPVVRAVLVIALLLGAYIEFQTPGVGIAGAVALIALITLLGAPFLIGLAEIWHILVFLLGFVLLVVELAFLPGFGLLGVAGVVMMLVGLVLSVIPTSGGGPVSLPAPEMWNRLVASTLYMLVAIIVSMFGFFFLTRHLGHLPVFNRMILTDDPELTGRLAGAGAPAEAITAPPSGTAGPVEVGASGVTTTELRPSGTAEFDGRLVDVTSAGSWIDRGRAVKVIHVEGNRVTVDEA